MTPTVAVRMLRDWSVYKAGSVIPAVPRGQAAVWFQRHMAEPVDTPPAPLRSAELPESSAPAPAPAPSGPAGGGGAHGGRRSAFSQGTIKRRG
jgi:hypothetical protein